MVLHVPLPAYPVCKRRSGEGKLISVSDSAGNSYFQPLSFGRRFWFYVCCCCFFCLPFFAMLAVSRNIKTTKHTKSNQLFILVKCYLIEKCFEALRLTYRWLFVDAMELFKSATMLETLLQSNHIGNTLLEADTWLDSFEQHAIIARRLDFITMKCHILPSEYFCSALSIVR